MAKWKHVLRCELVVDAVGKKLVRCGKPAKHCLPDGTPQCAEHYAMSAEGKRSCG